MVVSSLINHVMHQEYLNADHYKYNTYLTLVVPKAMLAADFSFLNIIFVEDS